MREKSTLFACKLAYTSVEGDDLSAIGHNCEAIFFSILFFPNRWSSESRIKFYLNYAESRQRKTKSMRVFSTRSATTGDACVAKRSKKPEIRLIARKLVYRCEFEISCQRHYCDFVAIFLKEIKRSRPLCKLSLRALGDIFFRFSFLFLVFRSLIRIFANHKSMPK